MRALAAAMLHLEDHSAKCGVEAASSKANVFDLADDDGDIIRDAKKRWNSRFPMENGDLSFADAYLQGKLRIALELKVNVMGQEDCIYLLACISCEGYIAENIGANIEIGCNCGDANQRDNSSVLIQIGEFVKCGDCGVPSVVRLYVIDNSIPQRLGYGMLFRSLLQ